MSFSDQLKSQLDIVDVIGQYVRLKRSGSSLRYVGLCPFHSERTPSFSVHGGNQYYYCFSCQVGGDVFKFVQEMESLNFPEAVKLLAERAGIPVPQRQRSDDPETRRREALLEMHEIAAELFQANLRGPQGEEARNYLQQRGVTRGTADEFRLGLSIDSWDQLTHKLKRFGPDLMEASGLVSKRQSGSGFFDRFRSRLMFPIHSDGGKVIAFGARALQPGDTPKYLNSSDTPIYKKSSTLFNLHRAKIDARKKDRMLIVEGYMDAIGVYAAGIREVVAACGTALSNDQVRAIKREIAAGHATGGQVILNFDPDAAGARSAQKYIGHFLTEGLRVKILQLSGEADPDEYIQEHGAEEYSNQITQATPYFYWLVEQLRKQYDLGTIEGRADAFKALLPAIQHVHDPIERSAIANELAVYLKVDRDVILRQLKSASTDPTPSSNKRKENNAVLGFPPNEVLLLGCLLASEEARLVIVHFLKNDSVLTVLETVKIFEAVLRIEEEGVAFSLDVLSERIIDPRQKRLLVEVVFSGSPITADTAVAQALHCLKALEEKCRESKCSDLRRLIRDCEQKGDLQGALTLMTELDKARAAR